MLVCSLVGGTFARLRRLDYFVLYFLQPGAGRERRKAEGERVQVKGEGGGGASGSHGAHAIVSNPLSGGKARLSNQRTLRYLTAQSPARSRCGVRTHEGCFVFRVWPRSSVSPLPLSLSSPSSRARFRAHPGWFVATWKHGNMETRFTEKGRKPTTTRSEFLWCVAFSRLFSRGATRRSTPRTAAG